MQSRSSLWVVGTQSLGAGILALQPRCRPASHITWVWCLPLFTDCNFLLMQFLRGSSDGSYAGVPGYCMRLWSEVADGNSVSLCYTCQINIWNKKEKFNYMRYHHCILGPVLAGGWRFEPDLRIAPRCFEMWHEILNCQANCPFRKEMLVIIVRLMGFKHVHVHR